MGRKVAPEAVARSSRANARIDAPARSVKLDDAALFGQRPAATRRALFPSAAAGLAALLFTGGLAGNFAGLALAKGLDQRRLKVIFALSVLLVGAFTGLSALHLIPVNVK
ncbi:MAG: hypothetical protein ACREM2_01380 [Vulcanimicrobiaceae bacterium]